MAVVVLTAGVSNVSFADGYQSPGKGFVPPPTFNWSGVYAGVHGGYGWGDSEIVEHFLEAPPPNIIRFQTSFDAQGGLGGIHLGMNKQFGNFIIGGELRLSGAQIDGSTNDCLGIAQGIAPEVARCNAEVSWMAIALARLGYAHNRWLVYGTLGWAVAGVDYIASYSNEAGMTVSKGGANDTNDGFAFGGGVEYAFSNSVSAGIEYTRLNLESSPGDTLFRPVAPGFLSGDRDIDVETVTGRLNFRLGG